MVFPISSIILHVNSNIILYSEIIEYKIIYSESDCKQSENKIFLIDPKARKDTLEGTKT